MDMDPNSATPRRPQDFSERDQIRLSEDDVIDRSREKREGNHGDKNLFAHIGNRQSAVDRVLLVSFSCPRFDCFSTSKQSQSTTINTKV